MKAYEVLPTAGRHVPGTEDEMVEISCKEVIWQISDYLDGEIDSTQRKLITEHLKKCEHCTAIHDGSRNVIQLVCDERTFELPTGFSQRLQQRLAAQFSSAR
jgi:anti-sigma factor RsiW